MSCWCCGVWAPSLLTTLYGAGRHQLHPEGRCWASAFPASWCRRAAICSPSSRCARWPPRRWRRAAHRAGWHQASWAAPCWCGRSVPGVPVLGILLAAMFTLVAAEPHADPIRGRRDDSRVVRAGLRLHPDVDPVVADRHAGAGGARGAQPRRSRATSTPIWWCSTAPNSASCSADSTRWCTGCANASGCATCSAATSAARWRGRRAAEARSSAVKNAMPQSFSSTSSARRSW